MTIRAELKRSATTLRATSKTAQLDGEVLLAHVLNKDRSWLHAHSEDELSKEEKAKYSEYVNKRLLGEPVAYIVGFQEFYGRKFTVDSNVLVPRPESESFVELLKELARMPAPQGIHHILDMGTGSGCLAITAKLEVSRLYVTATDTSKDALSVAARNALAFACPITFKEQSLLTSDKEGYDLILANLPYVPENMQDPSITREPDEALYSGIDGLDHYTKLFEQLADKHIRYVMTESLVMQHKELKKLAEKARYRLEKTDGLVQLFVKTTNIHELLDKR